MKKILVSFKNILLLAAIILVAIQVASCDPAKGIAYAPYEGSSDTDTDTDTDDSGNGDASDAG